MKIILVIVVLAVIAWVVKNHGLIFKYLPPCFKHACCKHTCCSKQSTANGEQSSAPTSAATEDHREDHRENVVVQGKTGEPFIQDKKVKP
jgi:hypothetical protein